MYRDQVSFDQIAAGFRARCNHHQYLVQVGGDDLFTLSCIRPDEYVFPRQYFGYDIRMIFGIVNYDPVSAVGPAHGTPVLAVQLAAIL